MISKIELDFGWTRYGNETPIAPGTYYQLQIRKPDYLTKKRFGLIAAHRDRQFKWLAVYEPWVKFVLEGLFVKETSCYGRQEDLRIYEDLPPNLYSWQRRFLSDCATTILAGYNYRRGAVVSLGGGKTLVGLLLCQLGERACVLAPRHVHSTWKEQAERWGLECPIVSTYESAHRIAPVDVLILDECLRVKNPDAIRSQHAKALSKTASIVVGLTGRVSSGGGPLDWRWLDAVAPGCVPAGEVPWRFLFSDGTVEKEVVAGRKAYVTPPESWQTDKIAAFVSPWVMRVDTSELLAHLPPIQFQRLSVPTPADWQVIVKGAATERGASKRVAQARMASDGFVYGDDGQAIRLDTHKADAILEFVEGLGEPVVIVAAWRESITLLSQKFKDYNPAVVSGDTTDVGFELARFTGGLTDILILNARYGSGIDRLQKRARVGIFMSWSANPDDRSQMVGRLYRPGQDAGVVIIDTVAEGTLDDRVLELIDGHNELSEAMINSLLAEALG